MAAREETGADVRAQLAALLGKEETDIVNIRRTNEDPPAISVIDVVQVITGIAKTGFHQKGNLFITLSPPIFSDLGNCPNKKKLLEALALTFIH